MNKDMLTFSVILHMAEGYAIGLSKDEFQLTVTNHVFDKLKRALNNLKVKKDDVDNDSIMTPTLISRIGFALNDIEDLKNMYNNPSKVAGSPIAKLEYIEKLLEEIFK